MNRTTAQDRLATANIRFAAVMNDCRKVNTMTPALYAAIAEALREVDAARAERRVEISALAI